MSADDIIGIIGLGLAASGWLAFGLQYSQNQRDKRIARRADIERLDELIGQWMDKITAITTIDESYAVIAARINDFNHGMGGFETKIFHALNHLPSDQAFNDIRQRFTKFRTAAFDAKDGMISRLADEAHPPPKDLEERNRREAIAGLEKECADLQSLLRAHL
jgi:hypothetical protein